ncbi:hypothetical protein KUA08_13125 [Komagataeibacter melomenusus]|nr:hypothetical protein [Komagataeibacter melomenusus]
MGVGTGHCQAHDAIKYVSPAPNHCLRTAFYADAGPWHRFTGAASHKIKKNITGINSA